MVMLDIFYNSVGGLTTALNLIRSSITLPIELLGLIPSFLSSAVIITLTVMIVRFLLLK